MELKDRRLKNREIECKATVENNAIEISLHITAATCTKILNEIVGPMNWEKEYTNGNKNCIVRIWNDNRNCMISKEDCGGGVTEMDGYKGQASNGFKRVCALGWGIGIELYSQPTIKIPCTEENTVYDEKGNLIVVDKYIVKTIEYDNGTIEIKHVIIENKDGIVVYDGPNEKGENTITPPEPQEECPVEIPENADLINSEEDINTTTDVKSDNEYPETIIDLPDNTDGYDDIPDDFIKQKVPFESIDYKKEYDNEMARTHVRRSDILTVLGIQSFNELLTVDEIKLDETLRKLKAMSTR